jgi:hypothetical protein
MTLAKDQFVKHIEPQKSRQLQIEDDDNFPITSTTIATITSIPTTLTILTTITAILTITAKIG